MHQHVRLHLLRILQWLLHATEWLGLLLLEREQRHLRRRWPRGAVLVLRSRHGLQRLRRRACDTSASIASVASTIATIAAAAAAAAPIASIAAAAAAAAPTAILVAEPAKAAPDSTPASKSASIPAFAAVSTRFAPISVPSAAAVPLPTGRGCPVHQHVLRLLLLWVLRQVHVLRGRSG